MFAYEAEKMPEIKGVVKFKPSKFADFRGDLWTLWSNEIDDLRGYNFVLDKVSVSHRNVWRGLHGDSKSTKLISVLHGEALFVLLDRRSQSATYDNHIFVKLTSSEMYLVPPGVLNGFWVTSPTCVFWYKWAFEGKYLDASEQITVSLNELAGRNIPWPDEAPIVSERDSF